MIQAPIRNIERNDLVVDMAGRILASAYGLYSQIELLGYVRQGFLQIRIVCCCSSVCLPICLNFSGCFAAGKEHAEIKMAAFGGMKTV